jgi:hypothetical protein
MDLSLVRDDRPDISTTVAGCPTPRAAQIFSPVINKTDSSASVAVDLLRAVQHKDDDASPAALQAERAQRGEQRQQRQRDDWHADPNYPLQETGDDQAAKHGSYDTCLLEMTGADQHEV